MPNPVDEAIAELTTTEAESDAAADALIAAYADVPRLIQDAFDRGIAAGATPAQMQAFADLSTKIKANTAQMIAALAAPVPPEA